MESTNASACLACSVTAAPRTISWSVRLLASLVSATVPRASATALSVWAPDAAVQVLEGLLPYKPPATATDCPGARAPV
ncbi:hypothetical protein D3C76_1362020 [compost metagenome]